MRQDSPERTGFAGRKVHAMKGRQTALTALVSLFLLGIGPVQVKAFDWPQKETSADSFFSYFGQRRGGTIASALVFMDNAEVRAADAGTVIAVISEHENDFGWFESPLGNAVIVSHKNEMATVYANLEGGTIPDTVMNAGSVAAGAVLGTSGNSGWQEGQSCLEFHVLDTKNESTINPRILMPRIGKELPLVIGDISLADKNGTIHQLASERVLNAGNYSLYRKRQPVATPYRTVVSVNGASVETISYDMLKEIDGRLCATGNTGYAVEELYPDESRQLLAQLILTRGRNTVTIAIADILGETKTISYVLDVR